MMRSLYSGVSGLQNHQVRTDVIGNNIANINTSGFKKNRTTFQSMVYQMMEGAAKPTENKGGVNAKQVGLGMSVAGIDNLMTQGSLQTTGKKSDLALQGDGFFVTRLGQRILYTRSGNCSIDAQGFFVNGANGMKMQGWNAIQDENGEFYINASKSHEDIHIPVGEKSPGRATGQIKYQCNLNARVDSVENPKVPSEGDKKSGRVHYTSMDVYDWQGKTRKMELSFTKVGNNVWRGEVHVPEAVRDSLRVDVGSQGNVFANQDEANVFYVDFDERGALQSVREGSSGMDILSNGELSVNIKYKIQSEDDVLGMESMKTKSQELGYEQETKLVLGTAGEFNGVTQMVGESTTKGVFQNGYGMGYLQSFQVDSSGTITGVYSNGQVRPLAQVAIAKFINPEGLEKVGLTHFADSNNSGIANIGISGSQGRADVVSGALEMSNVDLSEEFTNMIVTQRGFQANSKIITTSDQMLQELLTLKR